MLLWIDGGSSGGVPADDSRGPGDATRILAQVATAAGLPAAVVPTPILSNVGITASVTCAVWLTVMVAG
jgi:hypothetical protein